MERVLERRARQSAFLDGVPGETFGTSVPSDSGIWHEGASWKSLHKGCILCIVNLDSGILGRAVETRTSPICLLLRDFSRRPRPSLQSRPSRPSFLPLTIAISAK